MAGPRRAKTKTILAVTMGDVAGIGPEIVAKALLGRPLPADLAVYLIVGDAAILEATCRRLKISRRPTMWDGKSDLARLPSGVYLFAATRLHPQDVRMGAPHRRWGEAAYQFIVCAADLALAGRVDGLVTSPISKEALHSAGHRFEGHTELLAHLSRAKTVRMMFLGPKLKVVLATIHIPLARVAPSLNTDGIFQTIRLGGQTLISLGIANPRIAVCGVNPHAGESGAFGKEDIQKIRPAVLAASRMGWRVTGPVAADSFFYQALHQDSTDLIVAMYHDQGLIPFKLLHFDKGVNTTVGLPFIRTSPDHGTAYDIAGKGIADPTSMQEAIRWALRMSAPSN